MIEKRFFLKNGVCGVITIPENTRNIEVAAVMLHGFASDKDESTCKGAYKELSCLLSQENIISLRIDFRGWGESKSIPQWRSTVDTMIEDATEAFLYIKKLSQYSIKNIGFIGFSLGSAIAILSANKLNNECAFLGLLSPAGNLPEDFEFFLGKEVYRELLSCNEYIHINLPWKKINLGAGFIKSLNDYNVKKELSKLSVPIICIAGKNDFSASHSEDFLDISKNTKSEIVIYEDTDHCLNAFSENIKIYDALNAIVNWIKNIN